jgi:hypothetical protein
MRRNAIVKAAFAALLGILGGLLAGFTEAQAQGRAVVDQPFPAYNPYPPLPAPSHLLFSRPICSRSY